VLASAAGGGMAWLSWLVLTRDHDSISWYFLDAVAAGGGGTNVVNVILVDFRGYDTFGEITVLGIAGSACWRCWTASVRRPAQDADRPPWTFASASR
jgi:multicomponent K+:H+ antiporter subunit A